MGACIGKKSSKYSTRYQPEITPPKIQDEVAQNKPSPSLSKKLQMIDDTIDKNNGEYRISELDENSIDLELKIILEEQKIINETFSQPLSSRIVSVTDSELEYELANLIYGHPEKDYIENPSISITDKSHSV
ncbi:unnamed protein product [Rotaria sordida]|uniref:Uncharacterized protein n=1 Tax=Rotaria sordida TaxID=392033 RepID=A0A819M7C8_9BILA|nr:unnamed protein product [Rotaria sordida]CAF0851812.1 unnamed protein product [Rotaria sordida]CAF0852772.1 unnamed protein product [Rotaria sordida]CAF0855058.1 unnamed protein product [Rotaria sordida]CAF0884168.1 unnamed protein product [Rotaria sordida]